MNFFRTFRSIRKRVRQRATRYSLLVVILLFGLFLEAYMHNFNLVYITLFFVFAAAFSAGPIGLWNLGRLEATWTGCERLFANKNAACLFEITNPGTMSAWAVTLRSPKGSTPLRELPPHTTHRARLPLHFDTRGRADAGPCTLESLFPLCTVRFVLNVRSDCALIVYPEPGGEPLRSYLLRTRAPFGDEIDFDGIARYSGGESLSRIHWPSVAKGEMNVKTFEHDTPSQTLLFDFYRCGSDDERRLSQLTLWVLECEKQHLPFAVRLPHRELHSSRESIDAILETLALY